MEEQLFTKRNKRRSIQQQIASIYDESRRLGVDNPPTLQEHCADIGISVTEAVKRAEARALEVDRARLKALRESKAETHKEEKMASRPEPKPPRVKGPTRSEQVYEIIRANGGATLTAIAERISASRDAAWGAVRPLIVAGRITAMKQEEGEEKIYLGVDGRKYCDRVRKFRNYRFHSSNTGTGNCHTRRRD